MRALLEIEEVWAAYEDGAPVLRNVSLRLDAGELVAVLGANGAGKTTLLRVVSGLLPCRRGRVRLTGEDIAGLLPHRRVAMGLVQVPEGRQMLSGLSVEENLLLGGYVHRHDASALARGLDEVYSLFPRLKERHRQLAGSLSGGEQQMVALGRALMAKPKLLLLDEPSFGLAPLVVTDTFAIIARLRDQGMPILLVEQNAKKALEVADRAVVLRDGAVVATGSAAELLASD